VRPSNPLVLLALAVGAGVVGWALFATSYSSFVSLPTYAAATAGLLAVFELGLAKVVRDKLRGRRRGRPMHPLQVARAAALAKASSAGGALLTGLYGGFLAYLLPDAGRNASKGDDAVVATVSAVVSLLLVGAALLLERVCRTPPQPDEG
jgi:hypothetical protein